MSNVAIRVAGLSKRYRIGAAAQRHRDLRDAITAAVRAPFRNISRLRNLPRFDENGEEENTVWALKDVSFDVNHGEVLAIIGRNGAGKSTLLKILSRITEPTSGRVQMHGRVGALLEVGTGFHQELTGRENVYLNGSILGMDKKYIDRRFDEIVEFSGVERFIDTPVKRYSSGMYLRLAFSVAAHLEPEILVVDEVLAVGDAEFQKKCLGKMGEVAGEGRTVLFVSHNMQAVKSLCHRGLLLGHGLVEAYGDTSTVVNRYLAGVSGGEQWRKSWLANEAPGNADFRLRSVQVRGAQTDGGTYRTDEAILIDLAFTLHSEPASGLCIGFDLTAADGGVVFRSYNTDMATEEMPPLKVGPNVLRCCIPSGLLKGGSYGVCPRVSVHNSYWIVSLDETISFNAVLSHGRSPFWSVLHEGNRPGPIAPILTWSASPT
jgi:lipopolysaccharide transport system ATP-binding protein